MARIHAITMRVPNAKGWEDIKRGVKLAKPQEMALNETLQEAFLGCEEMKRILPFSEFREGLEKIDKLLEKVERILLTRDVANALNQLETYGAIAHLISPSAVRELTDYREQLVQGQVLERVLADQKGDGISPSALDELSLLDRQRELNHRTIDVMELIIRQMRRPINTALHHSKPNKPGNRPKTDRDLLIFLLARDASKIIGEEVSDRKVSAFMNLCTWVLDACKVSTLGLEDAVPRCLERYETWLAWYNLPSHSVDIQERTEDEIAVMPDDPEPF